MKKKPRQRRSNDTLNAILEATLLILSEKVLEDTSTNQIAKKAGISIGSLYEYFSNKESIYGTLIEYNTSKAFDAFKKIVATEVSSLDELAEVIVNNFIWEEYFNKKFLFRNLYYNAPSKTKDRYNDNAILESIKILSQCLITRFNKKPDWAYRKSFEVVTSFFGFFVCFVTQKKINIDEEVIKQDLISTCKYHFNSP